MSSVILPITDNPCQSGNASLGIDEACLTIFNKNNRTAQLFSIPAECHVRLCNSIPLGNISENGNASFTMSTKYPQHMWYTTDYQWCHLTYTFEEHGQYVWNFTDGGCPDLYTLKKPDNAYLPLLAGFMFYILAAILWSTSLFVIRVVRGRVFSNTSNVHDDLSRLQEAETLSQPIIKTSKASTRIKSIDTFRGIAILLMIFVNNGGGEYVFFKHSAWDGITVADLVLPWFAWIMGLTIMISNRAEFRVTNSRGKIILRCLRRSLSLIVLGLIVNSRRVQDLNTLRFPGVLQLLSVTYFICATIETTFTKPHSQDYSSQFGRFSFLRDILDSWIQWLFIIAIVIVHTCLTFLLPVPNCPKGYFGPGGYDHRGDYVNCTGGAAGYIDRLVFRNHTYSKTENPIFGHIMPHDPEGIMNTISAMFIVFLGVQAGRILLLYYQCNSRVLRWLIWAGLTGLGAGILCNFGSNHPIIPIIKKMMTLSYVLVTSSFAFLLYAVLYFLVDHKRYWSGAPFVYAGVNPILLYVGHYLTMDLFPWSWQIPGTPNHMSALAMNLWTTTLWAIIAYVFYIRDIIITI